MEFNADYTKYWSAAVLASIDGSKIAGPIEIQKYLRNLELRKDDLVLDLGCSYGRMFELLASFSDHIFGVDPEQTALEMARQMGYENLSQGSAERTNMPDNFFDFIFSWAVFDVVNQLDALFEANRILKPGGKLLFTAKNDKYHLDDRLAFVAEKNAFLKGFPNRFTNVSKLLENLPQLGLSVETLYLFPRRGDMGVGVFEECSMQNTWNIIAYEYLIVCRKSSDVRSPVSELKAIESEVSLTSGNLARERGFSSSLKYFESLGLN
jgi:SAM-dependent methyltransferase